MVLSFGEDKDVYCLNLLPIRKGALSNKVCLSDDGVFKAGECRELSSPYLNPKVLIPFFPFKGYDRLVVESRGKRFNILSRFAVDGRQGSTLGGIEAEPCPVGKIFNTADHSVDVVLGVGGYAEVICVGEVTDLGTVLKLIACIHFLIYSREHTLYGDVEQEGTQGAALLHTGSLGYVGGVAVSGADFGGGLMVNILAQTNETVRHIEPPHHVEHPVLGH